MKLITSITLLYLFVGLSTSCNKDPVLEPCEASIYEVTPNKIDRKALIIGIDGFRSDVLTTDNAPFLFTFSQRTDCYFTGQSKVEYHTSSGPNWTSLLTGVHWEKHKVDDNFFSLYNAETYPSLFYHIENAAASINTVSLCHWLPINSNIVNGLADYSPVEVNSDSAIYAKGLAIIEQTSSIPGDIIFLHFDDLDHFGHAYGFHDTITEYTQAVSIMDTYAAGLINAVNQRRSLNEDWIIFIVSDHGGEGTSHSGMPEIESVNKTIFFAQHPTENFKANYISSQVDLAPSLLKFMGIESTSFNCKKDGTSIIY